MEAPLPDGVGASMVGLMPSIVAVAGLIAGGSARAGPPPFPRLVTDHRRRHARCRWIVLPSASVR
jgi:hypothetical protein